MQTIFKEIEIPEKELNDVINQNLDKVHILYKEETENEADLCLCSSGRITGGWVWNLHFKSGDGKPDSAHWPSI